MHTSITDGRTISAAIEERVTLAVLLALNMAGLAGWLTLSILAALSAITLLRSPQFRPLLQVLGLERITWRAEAYRAWRTRYIAYRNGIGDRISNFGTLKSWYRKLTFHQDRLIYAITFVLAAMPYGFRMPAIFACGVLIMQVFVALSQWLSVRDYERKSMPI